MATAKKATSKRAVKKTTPRRKASTRPSKQRAAAADSPSCFVIMPFGGWFDDYFESIYKPALEEAGLKVNRADDLYRPSTIVNDIWTYTQSAKLILADLSNKNPNVFYELGLAHALAKPAILITESIEDVPFDLRALRVIEYDKNQPRWGEVLHEKIANSAREVLQVPLESVLPAFLHVSKQAKPQSVSEQEKAVLDLRRDFDLLRSELLSPRNIYRHPSAAEVSAGTAKDMIRRYIDRGLSLDEIMARMAPLRVPKSFVARIFEQTTSRQRAAITSDPPNDGVGE